MKSAGYEIKTGANMAVKSPGQKRFIRLSSLPDGYKEADIGAVLSGKVKLQGRTSAGTANQYRSRAGSWLIDVEKKLTEKGPGYAQWAKRHNLKQVSKSFLFIRDQKIRGLSHLSSLVEEKTKARDELLASIKATEVRLAEIATLKKHIINYSKTRSTYEEYRKAGYSKKLFETHREEITLHKAAKQAFDDLGVKKIPKVKDLNEEYARLLSGKKTAYAEYRKLRDEAQELVIAQSNIGSIFEYGNEKVREHEKEMQKR